VPAWLLHEAQMLDYLGSRRTAALPLGAWTWNLRRLRSALRLRRPSNGVDTQGLLHRSWRGFPWLLPDNRLFRPDPHRVGSSVALDGVRDGDHLVFGWYEAEREGGVDFRRTSGAASVLMRAASSRRLKLDWRNGRSGRQVELGMRRIGDIDPLWRASAVPAESWSTCVRDCALPDGVYELLLETAPTQTSFRPRVFGVAVARVELE